MLSSGPNQPGGEHFEMRDSQFNLTEQTTCGEDLFDHMPLVPDHGGRLTIRLSRATVRALVDAADMIPDDAQEVLRPVTQEEYRSEKIIRYKFTAPLAFDHVWTSFPRVQAGNKETVTILFPSDGCETSSMCVLSNVRFRVGAMMFSAPTEYHAFGVILPVDMMHHVKLYACIPPLGVSLDNHRVSGWIQWSSMDRDFPNIGSPRYDAVSGLIVNALAYPPRYVTDFPDVNGATEVKAQWVTDEHAVVAFTDVKTLSFGSVDIKCGARTRGMDLKVCVKGGVRRREYFDVRGVSAGPYDAPTFVSEVTGGAVGRVRRVGESKPMEAEYEIKDVYKGYGCLCRHQIEKLRDEHGALPKRFQDMFGN